MKVKTDKQNYNNLRERTKMKRANRDVSKLKKREERSEEEGLRR